MGASTSSKFQGALVSGDTKRAMKYYLRDASVRDEVTSATYGLEGGNNALHLATSHAMLDMVVALLEGGVNPNARNDQRQTALHTICNVTANAYPELQRQCLQLILLWNGPVCGDDSFETVDISAQDRSGNTALHLISQLGFTDCAELLMDSGCAIGLENAEGKSACELADSAGHTDLASLLESCVVFDADDDDDDDDVPPPPLAAPVLAAQPSFVGIERDGIEQERERRVEWVHVTLGIKREEAEALLVAFRWRKEALLEAYFTNPSAARQRAGLAPLAQVIHSRTEAAAAAAAAAQSQQQAVCAICQDELPPLALVRLTCGHAFCPDCVQDYMSMHSAASAPSLTCPAQSCSHPIPLYLRAQLLPGEQQSTLRDRIANAFVDSAPDLRWCPHPGCGRAVRRTKQAQRQVTDAAPSAAAATETKSGGSGDGGGDGTAVASTAASAAALPRTVMCGGDHFFCWNCGSQPHAPCPCAEWTQWLAAVQSLRSQQGGDGSSSSDGVDGDTNTAALQAAAEAQATELWLVQHTKQCPQCHSPIQKNEGCNHMTCRKCRHEFCWVCMGPWSQHGRRTGGYYRCNRTPAPAANRQNGEQLLQAQRRSRLLTHYTQFCAQEGSRRLEQALLEGCAQRSAALQGTLRGRAESNAAAFADAADAAAAAAAAATAAADGGSALKSVPATPSAPPLPLPTVGEGSAAPGLGPSTPIPSAPPLYPSLDPPTATAAAAAATTRDTAGESARGVAAVNVSFVKQATLELLCCRLVLRNSFALLEQLIAPRASDDHRQQFAEHQGILLGRTELLSAMIGRSRLKASRSAIIQAALFARGARQQFLATVSAILYPKPATAAAAAAAAPATVGAAVAEAVAAAATANGSGTRAALASAAGAAAGAAGAAAGVAAGVAVAAASRIAPASVQRVVGRLYSLTGWRTSATNAATAADGETKSSTATATTTAAESIPDPTASDAALAAALAMTAGAQQREGWICGTCEMFNAPSTSPCAACGAQRPSGGSGGGGGAVEERGWKCTNCPLINAPCHTRCQACDSPAPRAAAAADGHSPAAPPVPVVAALPPPLAERPKAADWICGGCALVNRAASLRCVACNNAQPLVLAAAAPNPLLAPQTAAAASAVGGGGNLNTGRHRVYGDSAPVASAAATWTIAEVSRWLASVGASRHVLNFRVQDINGVALLALSEADLKELGLASLGQRRTLLSQIATLA